MVKAELNQDCPITDCAGRRETEDISLALFLKAQNSASTSQSRGGREQAEILHGQNHDQSFKNLFATGEDQNRQRVTNTAHKLASIALLAAK